MMDAYLARLGVDRTAVADLDTLFAIHRAQVENISYENVDIYLGRPPGIEPAETFERIARGRGGYCYQLNGALATLLTHLGYAVTWHVAGVHGNEGPEGATGNHLALTVSGLPSAENPQGVWFVDAGLGDALYEPMPLQTGDYCQGPFRYRLERSTVVDGGWHFVHAPQASFAGMDFGPVVHGPADFAEFHRDRSTSPESSFTKVMVVSRRFAESVRIIRGVHLVDHDASGRTSRRLTDQGEWVGELTALLDLRDVDLDALWDKVNADHEAWVAAGGLSPAQPASAGGLSPAQPASAGGLSPAQPTSAGGGM
jgi:N-hydroxyarylamine O-acetyltransferase